MAEVTESAEVPRPARADAQRNRHSILQHAKRAFTEHGASASLDEIARAAGIGPGTLYRHFASRELLIEAVYLHEVEQLAAAADQLAATQPPLEALRAWMNLLIDHVAQKRLILPALDTVPGGSMRLVEGSRHLVHDAFQQLAKEAIRNGDLRKRTDPDDLLRALIGTFHTTAMPGWEPSARRIVDVLLRGCRPGHR